MTDVEQRLRNALNARAELVQPEDLNLNPVLEPPEPEVGRWWQHPSAYLLVAAVAVIVIALPLLALAATNPGGKSRDPGPAESPTNTETMTDPTPIEVDQDTADVDGDGTPDQIRVLSTEAPDAVVPDFEVTVELSETGMTVSYPVGQYGEVRIGATANIDGRPGEEIVAVLDPRSVDLHRDEPVVLSLRDELLVAILADPLGASGDPASGNTEAFWWLHEGQLWWWRSQEPVPPGGDAPFAVDLLKFPREAVLRGVDQGTFCVTNLAPTQAVECDNQPEPPTGTEGTDRAATRLAR
jgi:hypothetical protein